MIFPYYNDLLHVKSILVLFLVFLIVTWWIQHGQNLPPGPWRFPIIGSLPQFLWSTACNNEELHVLATRLGQKYGKIYSFDLIGLVFVVINDFSIIKEANNNPVLLNKGFNNELASITFGNVYHSFKHMVEYRKFALKTLRGFGVGKHSFEANIAAEFQALSQELDSKQGKPCNPSHIFVNASSNVLSAIVFGQRYYYDDEDFRYLTVLNARIVHLLGAGSWSLMLPKYYPNKNTKEMLNLLKDMFKFVDKRIEEHREKMDIERANDFIDVYLNKMEESVQSEDPCSFLQEDNLRAQLYLLFMAGADTTSTTLDWYCLYMMAYPGVQRKIQQEMDAVVSRNRMPQLSDQIQLPYTRAALLEMQRHIALVPLSTFHTANTETSIQGYRIPKGATIVSNVYAVMRDPKKFPEPNQFKTDRFIDDQGKYLEKEEVCPFGVGRRICLGENLAKMELFIFFTHLLHRYSLVKPDDASPVTMEGIYGATFTPKPFNVKFELRM